MAIIKKDGQGIYEWKNGDRFEGNFENGQINGYGRYSWTDGNVYQGDFKDGKQSGMGTAFYADKCNVYEGEWKNGKRNGHGKLTWANGDTYEGEWLLPMTRWQGMMMPMPLAPMACATALTPDVLPTLWAISR